MVDKRPLRPARAVIVLGASAGGVEALRAAVSQLPSDLPAAVLVVLHVPPGGYSVLPAILGRAGYLRAAHAADGERLEEGRILVAPPDYQMLVDGEVVRLERGPRENGFRPSIDVTFRSVAGQWGSAAAGVVLSGILDDGAAGLAAIKATGGYTVVQQPDDATFPDMPVAAMKLVSPDALCVAADVASCLQPWLEEVVRHSPSPDPEATVGDCSKERVLTPLGALTPLTCPECGGTLWSEGEPGAETYRCRVGHGFSARSLLVGKHDALEAALWAAIVALEERKDVLARIRRRLASAGRTATLQRYDVEIAEVTRHSEMVRDVLDRMLNTLMLLDDEDATDAGVEGRS